MMKKLFAAAAVSLSLIALPAQAGTDPSCMGKFYNPITDTNWLDFFPLTVFGYSLGPNQDPPDMYEEPVCICPGHFGIPTPGIGVSYFMPESVIEQERTPGCMSTIGGVQVLGSAYKMEQADKQRASSGNGENISRMQIHKYDYPLFKMVDLFMDFVCITMKDFDIAYITEIDPCWQNDEMCSILDPEAELFDNPIMQMVCSVDAIITGMTQLSTYMGVQGAMNAATDMLFWCVGSAGGVYPLTGNAESMNSDQMSNMLVLGKFIYRQARLGLEWGTIGPLAQCFSYPTPIWIKSQYRLQQINPIPVFWGPIAFGQTEWTWGMVPPANFPTHESTATLMWQGTQCCIRF